MKTYQKRKQEMQDKTNATEILRAFSKEQFEKIKPRIEERKAQGEELVDIFGGITTKTNLKELLNFNEKKIKELEELKKDKNRLKKAFIYEMYNHEYQYNGDIETILDCLYYNKGKDKKYHLKKEDLETYKKAEEYFYKHCEY